MPRQMSTFAKALLEGLDNAIAFTRGEPTPGTVVHFVSTPDVKAIRRALRMTQDDFAQTYKIPIATLKGWEQGRRRTDATVAAYLRVIERYPTEVRQALDAS